MRTGKILFLVSILQRERLVSDAACSRPAFAGDQTQDMSPTQMMKRAIRTQGGAPSDADVSSRPNIIRITRVFPESIFNFMFADANLGRGPQAGNGPYTYTNFLKAAAMWPDFCDYPSAVSWEPETLCKRELASMFAHFAQEVGENSSASSLPSWRQGLYYFAELGCNDDPSVAGCEYRGGTCDASSWMGQIWQCPTGVKYFGRGAKQLSYNFNYGPFSYAMFGDVNVLLKNPSLVVANDNTSGWLAFASAFWFYMTPQSPKPSMHDVVAGYWKPSTGDVEGKRTPGFGVLIMIINGGIECGGSSEIAQAANRISYYKSFVSAFGLPAESDASMTCTEMQPFDSSSSAFIHSYWDKSWSSQSCGTSCQLVGYQTGFSIFDDPLSPEIPYSKCAEFFSAETTNVGPSPDSSRPCSECKECVAVSGNYQSVTDAQCSPCGAGTLQTWWPCNLDGLCQCASTLLGTESSASTPILGSLLTVFLMISSTM